MSTLFELFDAHVAVMKLWTETADANWDDVKDRIEGPLTTTIKAILAHRPTTLEEVHYKAKFMAEYPAFSEWDEVERKALIEALTPVSGQA